MVDHVVVPPRRRSAAAIILAAGALLLGLPAGVAGQVVQGRVVEQAAGSPASGAFLSLVDTAGRDVAETMADGDGNYQLAAPSPGRYRVRVERIGHETWTSPPLELEAGATRTRRLEVPVEPVRLSTLRADVDRQCRTDPEEGEALARLWSEARKALEATSWTEEQGLLTFELDRWNRHLTSDLEVRRESHRRETGRGITPFVSAPVSWLSEEGWVQETGGAREYYGPDAEALLSPAFRQTHCFGVRDRGPEPGWVGVEFEPSPDHHVPDIRGVMWLDAETVELQRVEFRYVQADLPQAAGHAGGRVEFERLPSGAWIVEGWRIRMPLTGRERLQMPRSISGGGVRTEVRDVVRGYQEEAGRVVQVQDPDDEPMPADPEARVADAGDGDAAGEPGGGARDGEGAVEADTTKAPPSDDGLEGTLQRLGVDQVDEDRVRIDTAASARPEGEDDGDRGAPAVIAGRVQDTETGEPVPSARVRVAGRTAVADSAGRFRIEDVPAGRVAVEIEFLNFSARRSEMVVPAGDTIRPTLHVRTEPVDVSEVSVTVEGTSMSGKMSGFWERKRRGVGTFVTREEIEETAGGVEDVFRNLSGLQVIRCPGQYPPPDCHRVATTRGRPPLESGSRVCEVEYWLDGAPLAVSGQQGIQDLVSQEEVEAVEVYSGAARTPPQFTNARSSCGAVVIWTRSGRR